MVAMLDGIAATLPVVLPLHPRGAATLRAAGLRSGPRLRVVEPLGYVPFLSLVRGATVVVTDSGGIQEETTVLGVPCLTVRPNTERPITITHGTNRLVTPAAVPDAVAAIVADPPKPPGLEVRRCGTATPASGSPAASSTGSLARSGRRRICRRRSRHAVQPRTRQRERVRRRIPRASASTARGGRRGPSRGHRRADDSGIARPDPLGQERELATDPQLAEVDGGGRRPALERPGVDLGVERRLARPPWSKPAGRPSGRSVSVTPSMPGRSSRTAGRRVQPVSEPTVSCSRAREWYGSSCEVLPMSVPPGRSTRAISRSARPGRGRARAPGSSRRGRPTRPATGSSCRRRSGKPRRCAGVPAPLRVGDVDADPVDVGACARNQSTESPRPQPRSSIRAAARDRP